MSRSTDGEDAVATPAVTSCHGGPTMRTLIAALRRLRGSAAFSRHFMSRSTDGEDAVATTVATACHCAMAWRRALKSACRPVKIIVVFGPDGILKLTVAEFRA